MKHFILLLLTGLLISQSVQADLADTGYKKANPNQLAYTINETCSLNIEEAKSLVEGEFVRARIKPLSPSTKYKISIVNGKSVRRLVTPPIEEALFLSIELACMLPSKKFEAAQVTRSNPYFLMVRFGDERGEKAVFLRGHKYFGKGHDGMLAAIKDAVNVELTKYLKANFDL